MASFQGVNIPEIRVKGGFTVAKSVDSMIGDLVGTLTDPIIVYPGGSERVPHLVLDTREIVC